MHSLPVSLSALTASCGIAAAIVEVAVRLVFSREDFTASQILLAVFADAAVLGTVGWLLGRLGAALRVAPQPDTSAPPVHCGSRWLLLAMKLIVPGALIVCLAGSGAALQRTYASLEEPQVARLAAISEGTTYKPNVLLIVVDTLRWDRVGVYTRSKLTPCLDRLAQDAVVFQDAISTSPWTLPTHASLFSGVYPEEHGVSWAHYQLDDERPLLAGLLAEHGYHTFAVSNNWLLSAENGFARGFERYWESATDPLVQSWRLALRCTALAWISNCIGVPEELASDAGSAWTNWVVDRHLGSIEVVDRPFFGFLNYFEPHDPYSPPPAYKSSHLTPEQRDADRAWHQEQADLCAQACGLSDTLSPEEIELASALYDAEVAYQDEMLGQLFEVLERRGLLEKTWVIVTSDHGELFGEQGMVYHTAGTHYQLVHVPLIVRPPGGTARRSVAGPVQPVDVFHSILDIADVPLPVGLRGTHPLPLREGAVSEREVAITQTFGASISGLAAAQYRNLRVDYSRWLEWVTGVYVDGHLLKFDHRHPRGLFDVRHDPAMENDLRAAEGARVEAMMTKYRQWRDLVQPGESQ